jgi:DOPA 4,5-dioxygenase
MTQPHFADPATITGWHAHIYYDAATRPAAEAVRAAIATTFPSARLGRWHDTPIGPHPRSMYQVAFPAEMMPALLSWLVLNRQSLAVLVHPETGHELADHTHHAAWLGEILPLRTDLLSP